MENAYISFSKCIHVVLNGRKLPDLPCSHQYNCGQYHGLVHILDTSFIQSTFAPDLPVRIGAFPMRFVTEKNAFHQPYFYAAPGLEINIVIQREGGRPLFSQRSIKLPLQGFQNLDKDVILRPGAYTLVVQKGTRLVNPESDTVRAVRYIEMNAGCNILHGMIIEPDVQYVVICSRPFLEDPFVVDVDDGGVGGSMSYLQACAIANL